MHDKGHCLHPSLIPNPGPTECILSSLHSLAFAVLASNGERERRMKEGGGRKGGGRGERINQLVKHKLFNL